MIKTAILNYFKIMLLLTINTFKNVDTSDFAVRFETLMFLGSECSKSKSIILISQLAIKLIFEVLFMFLNHLINFTCFCWIKIMSSESLVKKFLMPFKKTKCHRLSLFLRTFRTFHITTADHTHHNRATKTNQPYDNNNTTKSSNERSTTSGSTQHSITVLITILFMSLPSNIHSVLYSGSQITSIAGTGTVDSTGDGGLPTSATLNKPTGVWIDSNGYLFITELGANKIRKVGSSGLISTIAGTGDFATPTDTTNACLDGGQATNALLNGPAGEIFFLYIVF